MNETMFVLNVYEVCEYRIGGQVLKQVLIRLLSFIIENLSIWLGLLNEYHYEVKCIHIFCFILFCLCF